MKILVKVTHAGKDIPVAYVYVNGKLEAVIRSQHPEIAALKIMRSMHEAAREAHR